jgi:hypothetical protein
VGAEELIGTEEDLGVPRDGLDYFDGIRRRAADVGLGLHLGGGVHIADHDGPGMLGLPGPQLCTVDRLGEAAARSRIRDQHRLVVGEDLGRLGHEVDATEHDGGRLDLGRQAGESERVAHVVRDVLDLRHLVVVRQDHRIAFLRQRQHLRLPVARQHLDVHGRIGHDVSVGGCAPAAARRAARHATRHATRCPSGPSGDAP